MIEHIRVPFLQAAYDATAGNRKVKRKDYLPEGPIPVLDQGQDFIAGYTTTDNAYTGQLPAVLFGDHTRIFKYVDFPFALGADGVKVLIPREGFDASFLYHYFRNAHIPSAGYSRHFKFLRELSVRKPPLSEQRRIVNILNRAAEIERLRSQVEELLQEFTLALFNKMFGEPAENPVLARSADRHSAAGGDMNILPLGEVMELVYGKGLPVRARRGGSVPVYGSNGVVGWHDEPLVCEPTVIVGRKGSVGAIHLSTNPSFPIDTTYFVRPKKGVHLDVTYASHALRFCDLSCLRTETAVPGLNRTDAYRVPFPLPPFDKQKKFAKIVKLAQTTSELANTGSGTASELTASLMSRLMAADA